MNLLVCDDCGLQFTPKALISHQNHHHNRESFPCDECEKTFSAPTRLKGFCAAHHFVHSLNLCNYFLFVTSRTPVFQPSWQYKTAIFCQVFGGQSSHVPHHQPLSPARSVPLLLENIQNHLHLETEGRQVGLQEPAASRIVVSGVKSCREDCVWTVGQVPKWQQSLPS